MIQKFNIFMIHGVLEKLSFVMLKSGQSLLFYLVNLDDLLRVIELSLL